MRRTGCPGSTYECVRHEFGRVLFRPLTCFWRRSELAGFGLITGKRRERRGPSGEKAGVETSARQGEDEGREMKKRNRNSVVGGNAILFRHANRSVRDRDVNYPIFFPARYRTRALRRGAINQFGGGNTILLPPAKNVVAHSITALATRQPSLPIDLDGSSYLTLPLFDRRSVGPKHR